MGEKQGHRRYLAVWAVLVVALAASGLTVAVTQQDATAQVCDDIDVAAADGGRGLAAAVEAADTCIGAQTITLEPGVYQLTSWLVIDDEVAIIGEPGGTSRIEASANLQPFVIQNVRGTVALWDLEVVGQTNP